jgi:hypothetical protein
MQQTMILLVNNTPELSIEDGWRNLKNVDVDVIPRVIQKLGVLKAKDSADQKYFISKPTRVTSSCEVCIETSRIMSI